jgi:hypothetical protein
LFRSVPSSILRLLVLILLAFCIPASLSSLTHDPPVDAAFNHFYNMEFDQATHDFENILARHPRDPSAVNHLLTSVLEHELYDTGAMNTGEYANDSFIGQTHRPGDPKVNRRIQQLVVLAEGLEEE